MNADIHNKSFEIFRKGNIRNNHLKIFKLFLSKISIISAIVMGIIIIATIKSNLIIETFNAISLTLLITSLILLGYSIYAYLYQNNLRNTLKKQKELSVVFTKIPQLLSENDKYFLYFHPYNNDKDTYLRIEISKELYEIYKEIVHNELFYSKDIIFEDGSIFNLIVSIETSTGLFDGNLEFVILNKFKNYSYDYKRFSI